MWSGKIELENLNLKRSLIEKLNLPVKLLMGKIAKLSIDVPWNRLSSTPVEVQVSGVNIVLVPQGQDEWEEKRDSIHTSFALRQKFIEKLTERIYGDLTASKEAVENEKGYIKKMTRRMIDNL